MASRKDSLKSILILTVTPYGINCVALSDINKRDTIKYSGSLIVASASAIGATPEQTFCLILFLPLVS